MQNSILIRSNDAAWNHSFIITDFIFIQNYFQNEALIRETEADLSSVPNRVKHVIYVNFNAVD